MLFHCYECLMVYDVITSSLFLLLPLFHSHFLSRSPSLSPPACLPPFFLSYSTSLSLSSLSLFCIDREKRDRQFASSLQFRTGTICDVSSMTVLPVYRIHLRQLINQNRLYFNANVIKVNDNMELCIHLY